MGDEIEFKRVQMPETNEQTRAVRRVAEAAHRLNAAVDQAVKAGFSVELVRCSRLHDGTGNWGDQMVPVIRERAPAQAAS
jgi:hypothetical protein